MPNDIINKNLPRDVFLYLLSIITLAIIGISFGTLIFQILNVYFPDILNYQPNSAYYDSIRYSVASLIVVFPVYLWIMKFLQKDLEVFPEKKDLKIRKWLLYFALFITAIIIIIDLIVLIFNFLQGELTIRFILKVITVFLIAGAIFIYYKRILKAGDFQEKGFELSILPKVVTAVIVAGVIGGIIIAGLPKDQRLVRFDERRISDLSLIYGQVDNYWMNNRKLPDSLSQLKSGLNINIPVDPVSNAPYEYIKTGDLKFQLCAVFQTAAKDNVGYNPSFAVMPLNQFYSQLQNHTQGRNCFESVINPSNYPIKGVVPGPAPM